MERSPPIAVDDSFVPLIDPDSDVRVWATLEEGCNAACHSVGWCEKEQTYFDDYGFTTRYLEAQNPKVITGRGGTHSHCFGSPSHALCIASLTTTMRRHPCLAILRQWNYLELGPCLFPVNMSVWPRTGETVWFSWKTTRISTTRCIVTSTQT